MGSMGMRSLFVALLCLSARAMSQVIYVDADATGASTGASWSDAYTDLQSALDVASGGDTIRIAGGTYLPSVESIPGLPASAAFRLAVPLTLRGGYAGAGAPDPDLRDLDLHTTSLSGDISTPASPYDKVVNVLLIQAGASGSVIDGLRVGDGLAAYYSNISGGVFKAEAGDLLMVDCTISNNTAYNGTVALSLGGGNVQMIRCRVEHNFHSAGSGGGPTVTFGGGELLLEGCVFQGNGGQAFSAFTISSGEVTARDCTFKGNFGSYSGGPTNYGGALSLLGTTFTGVRCVFDNNGSGAASMGYGHGQGGAIRATGATLHLQSCRFVGNDAYGGMTEAGKGGALHLTAGITRLENCLFSGNSAQSADVGLFPACQGGAIFAQGGAQLSLVACTVAGNRAVEDAGIFSHGEGGGLYGGAVIADSILWGNEDVASGFGEGAQLAGGAYMLNASCVQGLTGALGGSGNLGLDPLFADADGADSVKGTLDDDLHLLAGSPCADAASTPAIPLDVLDLDADGITAEKLPFDLDDTLRFADDISVADSGLGPSPNADMGAYERSAWKNLGESLAGTNGTAFHFGFGTLQAGSLTALAANHGVPGGVVYFCIGIAADNAPFKGGVMVPDLSPPGFASVHAFNALGNIALAGAWPAGIPSGATFYSQLWFADAGAPQGAAATNAIAGTAP